MGPDDVREGAAGEGEPGRVCLAVKGARKRRRWSKLRERLAIDV
jgi:hypothetical protein